MLERIDYVAGRASSVSQKLRMAGKDYSREGWCGWIGVIISPWVKS